MVIGNSTSISVNNIIFDNDFPLTPRNCLRKYEYYVHHMHNGSNVYAEADI